MQRIGPALEILTRRIAETPPDFLGELPTSPAEAKMVAALVNDIVSTLRTGGEHAELAQLARFLSNDDKTTSNRLAVVRIAVWLLAHPWFATQRLMPADVFHVLDVAIGELAATAPAHSFAFDADRREELTRVVLARLNFRPANETLAQATDRLSAISSTERRRLIEASRDAERRARAIREALVKKAAEESADKWTRE
jgi:hypothetical protein